MATGGKQNKSQLLLQVKLYSNSFVVCDRSSIGQAGTSSHHPVFLGCFFCSHEARFPLSSSFKDPTFFSYTRPTIIPARCLVINMNCRTFVPSIRSLRAPRHEAGFTPRHLIPCRYFARGYCSRGDTCTFSHSFPIQTQGLQGNYHTIVPFWNNYSAFSPQPYAKRHPEIRRPSVSESINLQPIATPPSPSSSVTTPDEFSSQFNFQLIGSSSPAPSIIVSDIMKVDSTLATSTRPSTTTNGDTSCDEFSTTRSDATRDEFLSPSSDVHFTEFYSITSPTYLTPVPYVQRGFGYRDKRARGRDNRRRRTRVKTISTATSNQQRESSASPTTGVHQETKTGKYGTTSDSDITPVKPHQENWRVIGGGVMLGTPTSATSRRKSKRLQSYARMVEEGRSSGSHDENPKSDPDLSMDESTEFSDLVASVKLTINRPPLADFIERPKSSLPTSKVSPLAAFFTHAEVA